MWRTKDTPSADPLNDRAALFRDDWDLDSLRTDGVQYMATGKYKSGNQAVRSKCCPVECLLGWHVPA